MLQHIQSESRFTKFNKSKLWIRFGQPIGWILLLVIAFNGDFNITFRQYFTMVGLTLLGLVSGWAIYDFYFIQIDCLEIIYSKKLDLIIFTYERHNRQVQL